MAVVVAEVGVIVVVHEGDHGEDDEDKGDDDGDDDVEW